MHLHGVLLLNIPDLDKTHGLRIFYIPLLSFLIPEQARSLAHTLYVNDVRRDCTPTLATIARAISKH